MPGLLEDLKKQTFTDFEIIVADNSSSDSTRAIARRFGCCIVKGGSPSVGRNNGAARAKGTWLVFIDADTRLPDPNFLLKLHRVVNKLSGHKIVLLPYVKFWGSKEFWKLMGNIYFYPLHKQIGFLKDFAYGGVIITPRRFFEELGGFPPDVRFTEDTHFTKKARAKGGQVLRVPLSVLTSDRRLGINYILRLSFINLLRPLYSVNGRIKVLIERIYWGEDS